MTTVKELIAILQKEDPTAQVILASDEEGNSYHHLDGCWTGAYTFGDEGDELEVGLAKLTAANRKEGFTKEDVIQNGNKAFILTP